MSRKIATEALKKAASYYLLDKGYSCHLELGLCRRGSLRGDVVAVNLRAQIVVAETKSCVSDYTTDKKWRAYLDYSSKFYFVFTAATFERLAERLKADLKGTGAGVLVLNEHTGFLEAKMNAQTRKVAGRVRKTLLTRMAWRSGISKRTSKCCRVYIEKGIK